MNRPLPYAACLAILALLSPTLAGAVDLPSRKPGLWVVTSKDNRLANWSACVDDSNDDFINSDLWANFASECKVIHTEKNGEGQAFLAYCESGLTGKVKLLVEFSGDFQKQYRLESTTVFAGKKGEESQSFTLDARYGGECPADLQAGQKKMAR